MRHYSPGGVSLQLIAVETLASASAAERFCEQLVDVLTQRLPLAVTVAGLGTVPEAAFGNACTVLRSAIDRAGVDAAMVSVALDATVLAPNKAWLLRREVLGPGPLYLLVGSSLTPPAMNSAARRQQDSFWLQCWQLRNNKHLRTALAPMVSSPCPLLPSETAGGILPPFGLQVPASTAWIQMPLTITDYVARNGELDVVALHEGLQRCIEFGEAMHDETDWPTAAMRQDAWLNRRLAISVNGIGDLAQLRGIDPGCFHALQDLGKVLREIRDVVIATSRRLALQTQPVPSLDIIDACRSVDWRERWHQALKFAAMRHRNLLAISPWALFPSTGIADSRYCDLLPLLEYADACSFPEPPCLDGWNINNFKYFHHRVSAVLGTKDARQLIAEQV